FARRRPAAPVAPWFERRRKTLVAGRTKTGAAEAAPFVSAAQGFVRPERDEMMNVIAAGIEPNVEPHKNSIGWLKPFREATAIVLPEPRLDLQTAFAADFTLGRREAERPGFDSRLLIPTRA